MKRRILHILIAFDQLVWTIVTLGWGLPDETISSASYRYETLGHTWAKIARPTIDFIFFWDPQHCKVSYESEILRTYAPKALSHLDSYVAVYQEVSKRVNESR